MVWLAKWILGNRTGSRVLIITDRTELDEQIEKVFKGVNEDIYRTKSGADLVDQLNRPDESLLCSLVHKFGGKEDSETASAEGAKDFIEALRKVPRDFRAKGDIHVFVDECHRTQSGDLHAAMTAASWRAVMAPKELKPAQIAYWDSVFQRLAQLDEWKKEVAENHWENTYLPADEAHRRLDREYAETKQILSELGMAK